MVVKGKLKWLRQFANIMDIVSLLPYFIELIVPDTRFLVVFRIFRLSRVIKLMRNSDAINNLINALKRSARALLAPLVFLIGCILFLSSVVYYSERGDFDSTLKNYMVEDCECTSTAAFYLNKTTCPKMVSKFTSIPTTMWWAIATLTTVGYGDLVPQCHIGKVFGSLTMVLGILFISMPIAIVGSYFAQVMKEYNAQCKLNVEKTAFQFKQNRKRVEELARNRQLHALETGEMRAFCAGRNLNQSETRDDMIEVIYEYLNIVAESDPGVDTRLMAPGEAMLEHLRTFVGDSVNLSDIDPILTHHLDVFLNRVSASFLKQSMGSPKVLNMSVCPCRLRLTKPSDNVSNTLLLSRPLTLTVGRRTPGVPDPDVILPVEEYAATRDLHAVSQRHAVIVINCTPMQWVTTIQPCPPNRVALNGELVPPEGLTLRQGDSIDFNPDGDAMEFRFEDDEFDLSTLRNSLMLTKDTQRTFTFSATKDSPDGPLGQSPSPPTRMSSYTSLRDPPLPARMQPPQAPSSPLMTQEETEMQPLHTYPSAPNLILPRPPSKLHLPACMQPQPAAPSSVPSKDPPNQPALPWFEVDSEML